MSGTPFVRGSVGGEALEEFHGAGVVAEALFFAAKLGGVGLAAAARETDRVLLVEHLVVKDVGDHVFRDAGAIELAIDDDLIESRIEAAQLRAPGAAAPADAREGKRTLEILLVQLFEERREIVVRARGLVGDAAGAALALLQDARAGGASVRELAVEFDEFVGRPPTIQSAEQNRGDRLYHGPRRFLQNVRNSDACRALAQPNRVREIGVGMIFDDELRRTSFAAEPGIDAMENLGASGHEPVMRLMGGRAPHCGFLRTGAGRAVFSAFSASEMASFVPSIASSSVSRYSSKSGPSFSYF